MMNISNYSGRAMNYPQLLTVTVQECLVFVNLGLRSIVCLFEKIKMDEDEVLLNSYVYYSAIGDDPFQKSSIKEE